MIWNVMRAASMDKEPDSSLAGVGELIDTTRRTAFTDMELASDESIFSGVQRPRMLSF